MIVISKNPQWRWRPEWARQTKGCYSYKCLYWGTLEIALVNERLSTIIQHQVRETIEAKQKGVKTRPH